MQAAQGERYQRVKVDFAVGDEGEKEMSREETREVETRFHSPEEEIA